MRFFFFQITLSVFFYCFRAFDVELLYIAQRLKIPIAEVAINWKEIDGLCSIPSYSFSLLV